MMITAPHSDIWLIRRNLTNFTIAANASRNLITGVPHVGIHVDIGRMCKGFTRIVGSIKSSENSAINGFVIYQGALLADATGALVVQWLVTSQYTLAPDVEQTFDLPVLCEIVKPVLTNGPALANVIVYGMLRVI